MSEDEEGLQQQMAAAAAEDGGGDALTDAGAEAGERPHGSGW